jgi:hypothetical protein
MRFDFTGSQNDEFLRDVLGLSKYPMDEAVAWISDNLNPDEVFAPAVLETWAEENGYTREE